MGKFIDVVVKRRIGMSVQQLAGIELSTFMVAKNTQDRFYQLMGSITQGLILLLEKRGKKPSVFCQNMLKEQTRKGIRKKGD